MRVSRSRLALLNIAAAVVGIALLLFTVQRAGGWGAIVQGVASIGWWFALVLLLGAFRMVCRARAWMICVDEPAAFRFRAEQRPKRWGGWTISSL